METIAIFLIVFFILGMFTAMFFDLMYSDFDD